MKRLAMILLILILIIPITTVNAENMVDHGEILLDQRVNYDKIKEIFTELDGQYYRKIIKDGKVSLVEPIELMPTGLIFEEETKDGVLGSILPNKLQDMGISSSNLPSQLDYSSSPLLPPVGLQEENSCVGWSAGYYLRTYQQAMDLGWKIKEGDIGNPNRIFSPSFIYNQINIGREEGKDSGAYMEDAGDLLKQMGAATLSNFPYIGGEYLRQPNQATIQSAYPHRIRDWKVLYTKDDSRDYIIQKTKEYLNTKDLLIAGIKVGFKFNYPYEDHLGNAIITTDNFANYGHAIVVVGYDDNLETPEGYGAFKIINSYGKDWGNEGFAYMSYDGFVAAVQSGYVFTDLINQEPIDTEKEEIENLVEDGVIFNIEFQGSGKYDIEIVNELGNKVHEEKNIQGKPGINTITWNGLDLEGKPAPYGEYTIKLLAQEYKFIKEGKLNSAKTYLNKLDDEIKSLEVVLNTKAKGTLNLYIESNNTTKTIYKGLSLEANKEYKYNIDILKFISQIDLKDAKVLIDIR